MWNADRTKYFGCRQPDWIESILIEAHCELHWLKVRTIQNIRHIGHVEAANAELAKVS